MSTRKVVSTFTAGLSTLLLASPVLASGSAPALDGSLLQAWWTIPFVCMLLSIAVLPIALPHFWHGHFGKVAAFWAFAFLVPFAFTFGVELAFSEMLHTLVLEYVPFLLLLLSLFTISGGIRLKGSLSGTPLLNTGLIALGTVCASLMGTTGASMLLIRPLLKANEHRKHKIHTVIFFIFLVANIGGSLTPLGDPPLFLGFLNGVDFFWTTTHLFMEMLFLSVTLLTLYFFLDTRQYAKEGRPTKPQDAQAEPEALGIEGGINFLLLIGVVGAVLLSGIWNPGTEIPFFHLHIKLQDMARDGLLLALAGVSLLVTTKQTRDLNGFSWEPIAEVAKLFFGIFISMIPAIAILKAGTNGDLRSVIALVSHNGQPVNNMYFWMSGLLSSFLDNAPTYLVFFNTAGGDAQMLMQEAPKTLAAISCGAVFMGANTYIGNAPNFMVRSIAESQGVQMPSFVGYMAWSLCILVPLFFLTSLIFFL